MDIMFHRIANRPMCCSISRFKTQVKLAKKVGATLTFDDGLKEHFTVAWPILMKYNVPGVFFIITGCHERMALSHKIWLLLNKADELIKQFKIDSDPYLPDYWYVYDRAEIANLKYYLNTHEKELDEIFNGYYDEEREIERFYMDWDDIRILHDSGMVIGNHTHTHPMLGTLTNEQQEFEIQHSTNLITRKVEKPLTFAYPLNSFNDFTVSLLKKYGYRSAVGYKPVNQFFFGRLDTNEFC